MTALREVFADFGINISGGEKLNQVDDKVDGLIGNLKKLGAALLGSALVQGVRTFAAEVQAAGDEINDTSNRLGIATDDLQAFRYAAKVAADQGPAELSASLQRLGLSIEAVGAGAKKQRKALQDLGVVGQDANGNMRPLGELLPELADGFAKLTTASERNAAATALFGKQGVKLGVLLGEGRAGLEKYREEFERFGGGFSDEAIKQAAEYGDAIDRLDLSLTSLKAVVGSSLLPMLATLTERFAAGAAATAKFLAGTKALQAALIVAGAVFARFAAQMIAANAPIILAAVGVAVLVAAVDDLLSLFSTDSESLIGSFVDEIWGVGTAAELVAKTINSLEYAWQQLKATVAGDFAEVERLQAEHAKDPVGNARFGDEISDEQRFQLANGGRTPDSRAQDVAVSSGNADDFVKARGRTQGREQAFEAFKEKRLGMINSGQVTASDKDRATFGDRIQPAAGRVNPSAAVSAPSKVIQIGATTIEVQVPAGSTREQADYISKQIGEEMDRRNRKAMAALGEQS